MAHDNKRESMSEFLARTGLTMEVVSIPARTGSIEMGKDASHWRCTIKNPRGFSMTIEYSMGSAHRKFKDKLQYGMLLNHDCESRMAKDVVGGRIEGKPVPHSLLFGKQTIAMKEFLKLATEPSQPDLASVLDCLASDASHYDDSPNFGSWAQDLGWSDDSIKAKNVYELRATQAKQLRHLLGDEYDTLLCSVERL